MFELYLDESYDSNRSQFMVVGGYAIEAQRARMMEQEWRTELQRANIPYFHMVDCVSGNGVFAKKSKEECDTVARKMISLIGQYADAGVAAAVPIKRHAIPHELTDTYSFAFTLCCHNFCGVYKDHDVSLFFEQGHPTANIAISSLQKIKEGRSITNVSSEIFGEKKHYPILQAADILVWQFAKFIKETAFGSRLIRRDFQALGESLFHSLCYIYCDSARVFCVFPDVPWKEFEGRRDLLKEIFGSGHSHRYMASIENMKETNASGFYFITRDDQLISFDPDQPYQLDL